MKKHSPLIKRLLSILSVFAVLMAFSVMGFSAAAEDHIVIAIHNTGREVHDNPLIRIFLHKDMFGSGGPFTIKAEYKVENFGLLCSVTSTPKSPWDLKRPRICGR